VPHTEDIERLVDAQAVIQQATLLGQATLGERAGKGALGTCQRFETLR
jgi:hypothetical protein